MNRRSRMTINCTRPPQWKGSIALALFAFFAVLIIAGVS